MRQSASLRKIKAERPPLDPGALRIYLRLLGYARPHWPMFLLGVVGMVLFAAVDTGFAILVKKFLDGAFVERDPRMLLYVPGGIIVLFLVRGVGDYLSVQPGHYRVGSITPDFAKFLLTNITDFDVPGELVGIGSTMPIYTTDRHPGTIAAILPKEFQKLGRTFRVVFLHPLVQINPVRMIVHGKQFYLLAFAVQIYRFGDNLVKC